MCDSLTETICSLYGVIHVIFSTILSPCVLLLLAPTALELNKVETHLAQTWTGPLTSPPPRLGLSLSRRA